MAISLHTTALPPGLIGADVAQDTLSQDEYEAFKAALPSWRDRLICMLLRNTGLRIDELLNQKPPTCRRPSPILKNGTLGGIRTHDLCLRRAAL